MPSRPMRMAHFRSDALISLCSSFLAKLAEYAHPERLVSTEWLAEHLGEPGLVTGLDGLDYDLARTGLVTRATAWILRSGLRDVVAAHAAWDAGPDVAAMRQRLDEALDRELAPGVTLAGEILSLGTVGRGVYPDSTSLTILLQADGVLRATVTMPDDRR